MAYRVLHLSDLHFGEEHAFAQDGYPSGQRRLATAIKRSLEQAGQSTEFDAVVISGDIYTVVDMPERTKARIELEALKEAFPTDHWVVVPGNHDLSWDDDHADDRFVHFNNLLTELWPGVALPRDLPQVSQLLAQEGQKPLAFVSIDSCRQEGPVQAGLGYVGDDQLDLIQGRLVAAGISPQTHAIVAVLHHHLIAVSAVPDLPRSPAQDERRIIVSVTLDASRTLRALADAGVALVLLGHQHTAKILAHNDRDFGERGPVYLASAGSSGLAGANMFRHFFVWEFEGDTARAIYMQQRVDDPFAFEMLADPPVLELAPSETPPA